MNALDKYKRFPSSRYMGSKNKIIDDLFKVFANLEFETALDLFSGSGSVSYLFKCMGKKVISNDYLAFSSNIAKAIISNNKIKLSDKDLDNLVKAPKEYDKFVQTKFNKIFFSKSDNNFIDIVRHNIGNLKNGYKKSIALASLIKACQKKQPRGLFTFVGFRYDDGRLDLKKTMNEQFLDAVKVFNEAIFNNGKKNTVSNNDFQKVKKNADLIYIDPPYFSKLSDNQYVRRYHFLEGIAKNWKGLTIQENSVVKKFKKYPSMFDTEEGSKLAISYLIRKYSKSIIIFSYSSNSLPNLNYFQQEGKKNKMKVDVKKIKHTYSFGTQKKSSLMKNKVEEFIICMTKNA